MRNLRSECTTFSSATMRGAAMRWPYPRSCARSREHSTANPAVPRCEGVPAHSGGRPRRTSELAARAAAGRRARATFHARAGPETGAGNRALRPVLYTDPRMVIAAVIPSVCLRQLALQRAER